MTQIESVADSEKSLKEDQMRDRISVERYGKRFADLPDDGEEQDCVSGMMEEEIKQAVRTLWSMGKSLLFAEQTLNVRLDFIGGSVNPAKDIQAGNFKVNFNR